MGTQKAHHNKAPAKSSGSFATRTLLLVNQEAQYMAARCCLRSRFSVSNILRPGESLAPVCMRQFHAEKLRDETELSSAVRGLFRVRNWYPTSTVAAVAAHDGVSFVSSNGTTSLLRHGEAFLGDNFSRTCVEGPLQRVGLIGYGKMAADEDERSAVLDAPIDSGEVAANLQPRRFAVLTTGHAAEYTIKTYGGYGPMFMTMLRDPGEIWDEIFVVEGQFPSEEELDKYEGFVITGSRHDAHGHEEWIEKLCALLQKLHERRRKLLGVCFGHQVLSRALGGKTGRATVGWEVGLRNITPTPALLAKSYGVGLPPKIKILEVHQDQVLEMPPGAELLASSERTGIEMFSVGEHALAIQGHPEFFDDVVVDLLNNRLGKMMKEDDIKVAKASLSAAHADQKVWQKLCKDFLKGQQHSQS